MAGNYKLSQDLWNSAHAVEHVVSSINPELHALEQAVGTRLEDMDRRLRELEKRK